MDLSYASSPLFMGKTTAHDDKALEAPSAKKAMIGAGCCTEFDMVAERAAAPGSSLGGVGGTGGMG